MSQGTFPVPRRGSAREVCFHHFFDFIMIAGGDCRVPAGFDSPDTFWERQRQTPTKITLFRPVEKV